MGQSELLTALRRKGEEQAAAIRVKTEEEEAAVRLATTSTLADLQLVHERRLAAACDERRHDIMAQAKRRGALIRLRAEHGLALRLRQRAEACLGQLRDCRGEGLLQRLAEELPRAQWSRVRVAPADAAFAARLFTGATIEADPAISGGLETSSADNSLSVVNSLESRLAKAWPELLPDLFAGLKGELP